MPRMMLASTEFLPRNLSDYKVKLDLKDEELDRSFFQRMANRDICMVSLSWITEPPLRSILETITRMKKLELRGKFMQPSMLRLSFVQSLLQLTYLKITGYPNVEDPDVEAIARCCPNLTVWRLETSIQLSNMTLQAIARYQRQLTCLSINDSRNFTDEGIRFTCGGEQQLVGNQKLEVLYLAPQTLFTDQAISRMQSNLPNLRSLSLVACRHMTDGGVKILSKMPRLQFLMLNHSIISNVGLAHLALNKNLRTLGLSECYEIDDDGLISLASMPNLQTLDLGRNDIITDNGLANLSTSRISRLYLSYCHGVSDAGMQHLARMRSLTELHLEETLIGDDGVAALANGAWMGSILNLAATSVTNNCMVYLVRLTNLRELDMSSCKISCEGLRTLANRTPGLVKLSLHTTLWLTDLGLQYLKKIETLEELNLRNCGGISGNGLETLIKKLPMIKSVYVSDCNDDVIRLARREKVLETERVLNMYTGFYEPLPDF